MQISAQSVGINVALGIRKTFSVTSKSSFNIRQQILLTPDIKRYDNEIGDLFNEEGLFSLLYRPSRQVINEDGGDDDEDNEDDKGSPSSDGDDKDPLLGELDDRPIRIDWDWRTSSFAQYNREWFKWLRSLTGYSLQYDGKRVYHGFRAEVDYRPMRHWKKKKAIELTARIGFQVVGKKRNSKKASVMKWESQLTPRMDVMWNIKKEHTIVWSNSLNGAWDGPYFAFDRWRSALQLNFSYRKTHRFVFSFQRQQRLDKCRISYGAGMGYEVRF